MRRAAAGLTIALVTALALAPARGEDSKKKLDAIERAVREGKALDADLAKKAAALGKELEALRAQLVASAGAIQEREKRLSRLENELAELEVRERQRGEALAEGRARLALIMAALERLALRPPEAMIALPGETDDTIRSALLLRRYVPYFEEQAAALRRDLAEIAAIRGDIARRRSVIEQDTAELQKERTRLAALTTEKERLQHSTEEERRKAAARVKALAEKAKDLRDLMAKLDAERKARAEAEKHEQDTRQAARTVKPETLRSFEAAQGRLALPAAGRVVQQFGEETESGAPSRGIVIEARANAQIVAPYDGQVVFAGPFRGYGQILIIEHSEGYHTLLAGLSRVDAAQNQWLLAGEPVGILGKAEGGAPRIYLEIRLKGRPINPLPWLAAGNSKVSG